MSKNITIKDVAREAGVSIATISYYLNGKKKLKEETKEKILDVINRLGYNTNLAAKALVTSQSKLIGFVLATGSLESNPYYSTLLAGMNSAIKEHSEYDLLIAGSFEERNFKRAVIDWIKKRGLDAVVFMGLNDKEIIEELSKLNIPISLIDQDNYSFDNLYTIKIDDEMGGYIGTKHLISKGYKNIAFVGEGLVGEVTKLRYSGYKRALEEANLEINPKNLYDTQITYEGGINVGNTIMERKDIDAIFSVADVVAYGIMRTYIIAGYYIPKDIAIIGFDNLKSSSYMTPTLTSIDQNIFLKGKKSIEILLNGDKNQKIQNKILIPISLVKGETT
ncbi:MAG: LacI family DNA-binding transcriptional regulator [Fusobacteriaceae bacterium]|nr:LacI family DNA-binding transcriptional regulator [Fusobacteriaceae bacterium]